MNSIKVEFTTLKEVSELVKVANDKMTNILSYITNVSIDYQDMMISDAGNLFHEVIIKEQNTEKEKIMLYNQEIVNKLSDISKIYSETYNKIGELMK